MTLAQIVDPICEKRNRRLIDYEIRDIDESLVSSLTTIGHIISKEVRLIPKKSSMDKDGTASGSQLSTVRGGSEVCFGLLL